MAKMEQMTQSEIKQIVEMWESGNSISTIVRCFPYKPQTVKREITELRQNGVLKGRSGKTQEKTQERILQVYNSGITSPYEIAKKLEMHAPSVISTIGLLVRLGKIEKRTRPKHNFKKRKPTDFDKLCDKTREIFCELEKGLSGGAIARKYGVSRQWVSQIKKKQEKKKEQQNER